MDHFLDLKKKFWEGSARTGRNITDCCAVPLWYPRGISSRARRKHDKSVRGRVSRLQGRKCWVCPTGYLHRLTDILAAWQTCVILPDWEGKKQECWRNKMKSRGQWRGTGDKSSLMEGSGLLGGICKGSGGKDVTDFIWGEEDMPGCQSYCEKTGQQDIGCRVHKKYLCGRDDAFV